MAAQCWPWRRTTAQGAIGLYGGASLYDAVEQQDHIAAGNALGLPLAPYGDHVLVQYALVFTGAALSNS